MQNLAECYIVICRDDDQSDGTQGEYVLATRETFTHEDAVKYASTIAQGREPIIVLCPRGVTREAERAAYHRDEDTGLTEDQVRRIVDDKAEELASEFREELDRRATQIEDRINELEP